MTGATKTPSSDNEGQYLFLLLHYFFHSVSTGLDFLPRVSLGDEKRLGKLGELVIDLTKSFIENQTQESPPRCPDLHFLKTSPVRRQALVQGNRVAFDILPIGDARRDLPVGLVFNLR